MATEDSGGEGEADEWDPEPASLADGETRDDSSHAGRIAEQRRQILEDEELPEELRERVREKIDEAHDELEDDELDGDE